MRLEDLPTPALVLDLDRLERNCERMSARAAALGVQLRPHMKTAKSAEVARLATRERSAGITVSTLAELEYFARAGFGDITYAVGIAGHKVPAIAALKRRYGTRISLLADSLTAVAEVARQLEMAGETLALFLEIDCGGRRGGVLPEGPELMALGQAVQASPAFHSRVCSPTRARATTPRRPRPSATSRRTSARPSPWRRVAFARPASRCLW